MTRTGAVILAGGASRRMGRPKAWMPIAGRPLLAHVVDAFSALVDVIVVVGRAGVELPELPERVRRVDDDPAYTGGGPLVGLAAGLGQLDEQAAEVAFLGSCDSPLVSAVHVEFVLDGLGPERIAAVPSIGARGLHPLAGAVVVGHALRMARVLLDQGERSARSLYEGLDAVRLEEIPDSRVLLPCNTPEEFAAALQLLGLPG